MRRSGVTNLKDVKPGKVVKFKGGPGRPQLKKPRVLYRGPFTDWRWCYGGEARQARHIIANVLWHALADLPDDHNLKVEFKRTGMTEDEVLACEEIG